MAVLEVKNIRKSFDGEEVLKGIEFSMEKGEVIAIIGSSGSGKTTLLRCLNFLVTPDAGQIFVNDECIFDAQDIHKLSEKEVREKRLRFGLVFQSFNLFPQYNVLRNVTLAAELQVKEKLKETGATKQQKKQALEEVGARGEELLAQVGLLEKKNAYPCELSGGQQQRVAIARAVISNPKLVLADEPTGNLDSKNGQEVMLLLQELNREGTTIIMVTHSQHDAQYASRTICLFDGQIVTDVANKL